MLRPVAGRVQDPDRRLAHADELPVCERLERELGLAERVDVHGRVVLEREPAVPREVVRVGVRFENVRDPQAVPLRLFEVGLDRVGRVDDDGLPARLVADQVGRAAEVVIDALVKNHCPATLPATPARFLEVT